VSTRLAPLKPRTHVTGMTGKDEEREKRLAAALRENLRRRKAQGRGLAKSEPSEGDER